MVDDIQQIRRSQFVLTYGPGAIIEAKTGPRLILACSLGMKNFGTDLLEQNEISDNRMRMVLKNLFNKDARIFSLPTNESLGKPANVPIYYTREFPTWHICYEKHHHPPKNQPVLFHGTTCPLCKKSKTPSAVRFVVACPSGHLDDVDWQRVVHEFNHQCRPEYYWWNAHGSSLQAIEIECPSCHKSTDMKDAYSRNYDCTGTVSERKIREICSEKMAIMQRQSTSLRQINNITLLKIPEYSDNLSVILQNTKIRDSCLATINTAREFTDELTMAKLLPLITNSLVKAEIERDRVKALVDEISKLDVNELEDKISRQMDSSKNNLDYMFEEFESLSKGPRREYEFSVGPPTTTSSLDPIPPLNIFPVNEIKTVTVQTGYRRMVPFVEVEKRKLVSVATKMGEDFWFPGYESSGEGLFITISGNNNPVIGGPANKEWLENTTLSGAIGSLEADSIWRNFHQKPLWVWYHTLSHAIIEAISLTCGYSSASIRERIYLSRDETKGGILLYTTASGEDGSMGGLMESSKIFNEVLARALESLQFCSNDPLCHEERKTSNRVHGAACFSCQMISETSCEHGNYWLDRHLILGD